MRPIIVPLTHNKVCRDPILGRDPWFENPGHKQTEAAIYVKLNALQIWLAIMKKNIGLEHFQNKSHKLQKVRHHAPLHLRIWQS